MMSYIANFKKKTNYEGNPFFRVMAVLLVAMFILGMSGAEAKSQEPSAKDAAAYVEDLILSTVYQDGEAFAQRNPDLAHGTDAKAYGQEEKETFYRGLVQNTKANYNRDTGVQVADKTVNYVAAGLAKALQQAQFDVLDVTASEKQTFLVRVAVRGIDKSRLAADVVHAFKTRYPQAGTMSMAERMEKAARIEGERYFAVTEKDLAAPRIVVVRVVWYNGEYYVPYADDYVLPFMV